MTGEKVSGPRCDAVSVRVGPVESSGRAGVVAMSKLLDRPNTNLRGVVSLANFRGRILTLDLAHDRLVVETAASARTRVQAMNEVPARLATGMAGEDLDVFVAARAGGESLWLEWDSGHQASTFVAPHAAKAMGLADSVRRADGRMAVGRDSAVVPLQVRDIIYDGVLSAAFIERAVWTVDLAGGRRWVGPIDPIPAALAAAAPVVRESVDPSGIYEIRTTFGDNVQLSVMRIHRDAAELRGEIRGVGDDGVNVLQHVRASGNTLQYDLPLRQPTTVTLTFDGNVGQGEWTLNGRPAHTTAIKRK
jgi:hypothetical protein